MIKKQMPCETLPCIKPMLANPDKTKLVKNNKRYCLQEKFDGTRGLLYIDNGKVIHLMSRYCDRDMLINFPEILRDAQFLKVNNAILDGEITFFNSKDNPFFLTASATQPLKKKYKVKYMIFDIIKLNGKSTSQLPLHERLRILKEIIPESLEHIKIVPTYTDQKDFRKIYYKIIRRKGEGVMLKQTGSKYVQNSRDHWIKVKKEQDEDCVVCGITYGQGRRKKYFGALILGQYHRGRLRYVGNVGAGMSDEIIKELFKAISLMPPAQCPFNQKIYNVQKFVNPVIVVEVKCMERTKDGMLRLPVFKRIRTDKIPADCKF